MGVKLQEMQQIYQQTGEIDHSINCILTISLHSIERKSEIGDWKHHIVYESRGWTTDYSANKKIYIKKRSAIIPIDCIWLGACQKS